MGESGRERGDRLSLVPSFNANLSSEFDGLHAALQHGVTASIWISHGLSRVGLHSKSRGAVTARGPGQHAGVVIWSMDIAAAVAAAAAAARQKAAAVKAKAAPAPKAAAPRVVSSAQPQLTRPAGPPLLTQFSCGGWPPPGYLHARDLPMQMAMPGVVRHDVLVAKENCGRLIGRGGTTHKEMLAASGCVIHILDDEAPPGETTRRLVILVGTPAQVNLANAEVWKRTQPMPGAAGSLGAAAAADVLSLVPAPGHVGVEYVMPASATGRLLGSQGATIGSLRERSKCVIKLHEQLHGPGRSGLKGVLVQGLPADVQAAEALIRGALGPQAGELQLASEYVAPLKVSERSIA